MSQAPTNPPFVHVNVILRGFSERESHSGLPYLLGEFQQRYWLLHPRAVWDSTNNRLEIAIDYEGHNTMACAQAALDEVRDCVIACMEFESEEIHFEIENASFTPAT
jgi:hypothetical protein